MYFKGKAQKFDDTISVRNFVINKFENQQPVDFIEFGVHKAHISDGRIKHSLLLEIFTNSGVGTEIVRCQ